MGVGLTQGSRRRKMVQGVPGREHSEDESPEAETNELNLRMRRETGCSW